jgi:hypothetical protein
MHSPITHIVSADPKIKRSSEDYRCVYIYACPPNKVALRTNTKAFALSFVLALVSKATDLSHRSGDRRAKL